MSAWRCRRDSEGGVVRRIASHTAIGMGTAGLALGALAITWTVSAFSISAVGHPETLAVALCLSAAVIVAYGFPIYVRHNTKICVFSVPLYLMAVGLQPLM